MDRDAPPTTPADVVPPVEWATARAVGLAGVGLTGTAAAVGLVAAAAALTWPFDTARLLLVFAGAVTAGLAVSLRPDRWEVWAAGAAAAGLAYVGTPPHWDSFRFLFVVLGGAAVALGLLRVAPPGVRLAAVSGYVLYHFGGIFLATVSPPPTPWMVEQLYNRLGYTHYLHFTYLRNAYHFYSPEPGPASVLAILVKTEVGEETTADGARRKKYETRWVVLPRRPSDIRDPLGLTYYRRLALTEQLARGAYLGSVPPWFEKAELQERRNRLAAPTSDPYYPLVGDGGDYKLPSPDIARYQLPAYARHLLLEHTPSKEAAERTTVRIYRLEHRTLGVGEFTGKTMPDRKPIDPYHPTTYRPYYLGEFDALGRLVDPQDPMLYWVVPVVAKAPGADKKNYTDYLSAHAGLEFDWGQLR